MFSTYDAESSAFAGLTPRAAMAKRRQHTIHGSPTATNRMFGVARNLLPSDDLAWDCVQETLLNLPNQSDSFELPSLLRLTHLRGLTMRRSQRRRLRHEQSYCQLHPEVDCDCDPVQAAQVNELETVFRQKVEELPSEFRQVFLLHFSTGWDYLTIAQRLGLPIGTVRSRLSRARNLLRESLSPWLDDDSDREARN